ncbi:unnamed protein product [Miscanthus lutarioriparius]|uniref:Uncharacterized protein n=1 Tax=Miscanthus lutarioriparius TaxID=422564 RepID=A0A811M5L7_9POAL|nr:unnamed protein product [Miscanthus lutarioriparius]
MELSMSGGSLRTFGRCVTFLARVASELVLQAHPAKLEMHTLNCSRSAYASVSLARDFFDQYTLDAAASAPSSTPLQCSVLLKSLLAVLRTPRSTDSPSHSQNPTHPSSRSPSTASTVRTRYPLPSYPHLTSKVSTKNFLRSCVRKTYWIVCSAEPEVQSLSLDRGRFPSRLAIRPRELARLLSNFQSSLQELTIIATDPASGLPDAGGDVGGKAVELRSYNDPTKDDCDTRLHTQLWIDPAEEFVEFVHAGDPVDVTFGVKKLKAFLTFCEGCEVDMLLFFEKTGDYLTAMMPNNQLHQHNNTGEPRAAATPVPENVSNHTKIWSELSEVISAIPRSQHHPSNWVGADDNDDGNEDDEELLVQTTPHYMD